MSTDAAHSLSDVFGQRLEAEPVALTDHLDGLHLDGRHELESSWATIADYVRDVLGATDLDALHVDELVVLPGLEEILALARLRSLIAQERWDAVIVDCAPSADSLRLLSLPDALGWYVDRLFGRSGLVGGWLRRRVERSFAIPAPDDDVVASIGELADQLRRLRTSLAAATTTARVVVTPEQVVVAEAQRTLTYLALYGYAVDAVLVNRVLPPEVAAAGLQAWACAEERQLERIDAVFAPLVRPRVSLRQSEPIGLDALREVGAELHAGLDPLACLSPCPALEIRSEGPCSILTIPARGIDREDIQMERIGDDLVLTLGHHRRWLRLPDGFRERRVVGASTNAAAVEITFGEAVRAG